MSAQMVGLSDILTLMVPFYLLKSHILCWTVAETHFSCMDRACAL